MPGPVPKRSDERRRRNKSSRAEAVPVVGVVEIPAAHEDWHPIARDWYVSLSLSGQAKFYEPSDWQQARLWAEVLSRQLDGRVSAQMMATWSAAATELLTTEGARRRARMEIERKSVEAAPALVASLDDYRDL